MKSIPSLVAAVLMCSYTVLSAATFTVTTAADSGPGSLREAILSANGSVGQDRISFNIAAPGPYNITLATALPVVTDPVIVDGSSQPGFAGRPMIEISGHLLPPANGLVIRTTNSTIQGLAINRFSGAGISIQTNGNNIIKGNFIGIDLTGTTGRGNQSGIVIQRSRGNKVGGTTAQERNLISANATGIQMLGSSLNTVSGNYIGTDVTGKLSLGNGNGILVESNCTDNTIGGSAAGNLISASTNDGIRIVAAMQNTVSGNYIGTDATGSNALGNAGQGILVKDGSQYNMIGGSGATNRNVIAGNHGAGVLMQGAATSENFVLGNYIGLKAGGGNSLPNTNGIALIDGASANIIGGPPPDGNVISGNEGCGILISGVDSSDNLIQGNRIGVDSSGKMSVSNSGPGIWILNGAQFNQVGGSESGQGNTIAYNAGDGILLQDQDTTGNMMYGNAIYSNYGLGINLRKPGEPANTVTPNDPLDVDTGPNNLQNFPLITNVLRAGSTTTIQGLLSSQSNTSYVLDFYLNSTPEATGSGEGQAYLGFIDVTTDAGGVARFSFTGGASDSNQYFTATATSNDTSEFSPDFGGFMFLFWAVQGNDFQVKFTTSPGLFYRLEKSTLIVPISWTPVPNATRIEGTGNAITVTDPGGAVGKKIFYRLVVVP